MSSSNKTMAQKVAKQVRQVRDEALKQAAPPPREKTGQVLEQLGVGGSTQQSGQAKPTAVYSQKQHLEKLEARDKAQREQKIIELKKELEAEIEKFRRLREEQLRRRRMAQQPELTTEEIKKQKKQAAVDQMRASSRPKGPQGLVAGLRARARKSKAELAGGRRSG